MIQDRAVGRLLKNTAHGLRISLNPEEEVKIKALDLKCVVKIKALDLKCVVKFKALDLKCDVKIKALNLKCGVIQIQRLL